MPEKSRQVTAKDLVEFNEETKHLFFKAIKVHHSIPSEKLPKGYCAHLVCYLALNGNDQEFLRIGEFDHDPDTKRLLDLELEDFQTFKKNNPKYFNKKV